MSGRDSQLEQQWRRLLPPDGAVLEGSRADEGGGPAVYVAVDYAGTRHLLVETADIEPPHVRRTHGLEVQVRQVSVSGEAERSWVDLACLDEGGYRAFTALAAEIINALPPSPTQSAQTVATVLARWRWFWEADASRLNGEGALGLFGELWFLLHWVAPFTAAAVRRWSGPLGTRHDFVSPQLSVEVKTTVRSSGPVVHRVAGLGQLDDPERGRLALFSLQVARDELAANSLTGLVLELTDRTRSDPAAADAATERLAAAGWTPSNADLFRQGYRIVSQRLYMVKQDFPRLTPASFVSGVPAGVSDVSYNISTAGCAEFVVASSPDEAAQYTRCLFE